MKKWFLFLFSGWFFTNTIKAQSLDSMMAVYHDDYQPEKIHIQFDRSSYQLGETIWFKAYLMAGQDRSDFSRNFYADWYDDGGNLVTHTVNPVFESSARGQFDIPAKYKGKMLHLRAYTQWMLNFDSSFLFTKDIPLIQPAVAAKASANTIPATVLHFFPEGGNLISKINSTVGFMATDVFGIPVSIRGAIFNAKNELIDSIASTHDGMGKFALEPAAGDQYSCIWKDEFGNTHTTALPSVKTSGIAIECKPVGHKVMFVLKRTDDAANNFKQLHAVASINQKLIYNASINLTAKKNAAGQFATDSIGTGVVQLTIFDADWIPVSERVIFVNNNDYRFDPALSIVNKRIGKRAKNEFELLVPDSIAANLSISVTDASLSVDTSTNIFSNFLLSGDIKGFIKNPAYYLANGDVETTQNIDLVMLTHGWRKINWEAIRQNKTPKFVFSMDSDYLQIKGNVYEGGHKSAVLNNNLKLSLTMQAKDSSKQYFLVDVDKNGGFRQRGLIFFDTSSVFYQLNDKRLNDVVSVNFARTLPEVPFKSKVNLPAYLSSNLGFLNDDDQWFTKSNRLKKMADSAVMLKEVIVRGRTKTPAEILDDKYTSGLFSTKNAYSFDVAGDQRSHGAIDIFHYLQGMVPGMSMSIPIMGANGAADANSDNVPGISWRDGTPDFFLNEMPSDGLTIMGIQMSDIAYIKVIRPPFMMSSGSGASGAIAVYTKTPMDKYVNNIRGLSSVILTGYTAYKEFFSPNYAQAPVKTSADIRPTLYWNPYLLTDKKNRSAKFEFYNNDITTKFRVVIEGVNAEGKMARLVQVIE